MSLEMPGITQPLFKNNTGLGDGTEDDGVFSYEDHKKWLAEVKETNDKINQGVIDLLQKALEHLTEKKTSEGGPSSGPNKP